MAKFGDGAAPAIERILSAYGLSSQKELGEKLGIYANNISSWLARDSVPGNVFVECALETGVDIEWLVTGKFAKSKSVSSKIQLKGKPLYDEIMASGGKTVLRRILDAYGFRQQKELGDLLDIPSGTISTWIRRDFFPGDVVVTCALDTGVSLEWLATGKGEMWENREDATYQKSSVKKYRLEAGELKPAGLWLADPSLLTDNHESLMLIEGIGSSWLVDSSTSTIGNGRWLIGIDGALDVFDVIRLPGSKVRLSNKSASFECGLSDITPSGAIVLTLEKHL
ncbi:phage repressor protein CI [Klebsiella oxytoca]|uniref:phage repressor protein CI n=1 Tax=Klebsiella oxytoca TaxID=571 RepID=UPI0007CCF61D|nr:phage repressor protein CI [Klebsiella oxytoca]SAQ57883.1 CI repressor [Klebsiella oxytoca]